VIGRGTVVKSIAGHDKNRFYLVLAREGDFALIADGAVRKLSAPKKKRLKHLRQTLTVIDPGTVLTDKALKAALRPFNTTETIDQEGGGILGKE